MVDRCGAAAGDVAVAEVLAHDGAVFTFHQGIVVGVSGAGLGELSDLEFVEQAGELAVDVLRAIVGVEGQHGEGEAVEEGFEDGQQEAFADALERADELELGDLIDQIDVVETLDAVQIARWTESTRRKPGWPLGAGLRRSPMLTLTGCVLSTGAAPALVGLGLSEVVEVAVGDTRQARVAPIAEEHVGALTELAGGGAGEGGVQGVDLGEQQDILTGIAARERLVGSTAAIIDPASGAEPGDQPGHLRPERPVTLLR